MTTIFTVNPKPQPEVQPHVKDRGIVGLSRRLCHLFTHSHCLITQERAGGRDGEGRRGGGGGKRAGALREVMERMFK